MSILGGAGAPALAAPAISGTLEVVINEIAWGGTQASVNDEWIELYNPGANPVIVDNWTLKASGWGAAITLTGSIPDNGYYLLERNDPGDDSTIDDIAADIIYAQKLGDTGDVLELRDENGILIDTANQGATGWFAGAADPNYNSMERVGVLEDLSSFWHTNNGLTKNGQDAAGNPIHGTPGQPNSKKVYISEIAWAGTQAYGGDEWVELYNDDPNPIELDGYILTNESGSFYIAFNNGDVIFPGQFFLIERGNEPTLNSPVTSEIEDKNYPSALLEDAGETLYLMDNNRRLVDTANIAGGAWPAGGGSHFSSMERIKDADGVRSDQEYGRYAWITNVGTVRNGYDAAGNEIYGTPKQANWAFSVTPTATPKPPTPTPPPTKTPKRDLVISEIAWAGTQASYDDEWIELYNNSEKAIDLTGWVLKGDYNDPYIQLGNADEPILKSGEYFLLERGDEETVADESEKINKGMTYSGSLSNSGETLTLLDPAGNVVDTANRNGGYWPAGDQNTYASMQRSFYDDYDRDAVWVTYDAKEDKAKKQHDAGGHIIKGTPGRKNWPNNVFPTPTPQRTPTSRSTAVVIGTVVAPILGISEFLPRPGHDWNNDGKVNVDDEFIEIINAGKIDIDLSAYRLDDEQDRGSAPFTLPALKLKPGERAVFYAADTGILLSDAGDTVRLLKGSSTIIDARTYSVVRYPDLSHCRIPDRMGYWNEPCFPTPGNPNALTGDYPSQPHSNPHAPLPVCILPDTTPEEFVRAECAASGAGIWNRAFWDGYGIFELPLINASQKWFTIFQ